MKTIKLKSDVEILIDDEDYDRVKGYKWWVSSYSKKKYKFIQTGIYVKGKQIRFRLSRFILGIKDPKLEVRFKDNNYLNNQKSNLIVVDKAKVAKTARTGLDYKQRSETLAKQKNPYTPRPDSKNRYRGVHYSKRDNIYLAGFSYMGVKYHVGSFKEEIEAVIKWNEKYREAVGEGAYQNPV